MRRRWSAVWLEQTDHLLHALEVQLDGAVEMGDVAVVRLGLLDDFPSESVALRRGGCALEGLDHVVEGVNDIFWPTFGGIAVGPGIAGLPGFEDFGEGVRGGRRWNGGRDGERAVLGEEAGEDKVWISP